VLSILKRKGTFHFYNVQEWSGGFPSSFIFK
jgi:hypothetical protein